MAKAIYKVSVPEELRDLIQRAGLEYHQKEKVVTGLIEDHRFDDDTSFIDSDIFQAYEKKMAEALFEFELLQNELEKKYIPKECVGKQYKWHLDYASCEVTFTVI